MNPPNALIIDDDTKNIGVLAQLLSLEGVKVTSVSQPRQLDQYLANLETLDVIFLDLEMPGIDGYQIKDQLRAQPRFANTPIVAYTVHVSEIEAVHQQGFDSFLGKPLDAENFPEHLARILRGESVWVK